MAKNTLNDFYSDLSFSPSLNNESDLSQVYGKDSIKQSLTSILNTVKGTRIMNANFGCNVSFYLFELFDEKTTKAIINDIKTNFSTFEPRISITKTNTELDYDNQNYNIEVYYNIIETGENDVFTAVLQKL